jgi:hypothetical protein
MAHVADYLQTVCSGRYGRCGALDGKCFAMTDKMADGG